MAALATAGDIELRLARDFSDAERARVEAILDDVSAAVRAYTGQQFTLEATTDRLPVRDGVVHLPQRPVTAVSAVVDIYGNAISYTWLGFDSVTFGPNGIDWFEINWTWRSSALSAVDVTYTHGYSTVPADIVAVVCQMAGRAYGTASSESGVTQESLGAYSYSQGGASAAGPLGMLAAERATLDRYRKPISNIQVRR